MSIIISPAALREVSNVPDWFKRALHEIDPALIVYWNPHRCRFIIDRCTAGGPKRSANHEHTPECPRTNVRIVQGEGGEYMPLCESVLDWLRAHDNWKQFANEHDYITHLSNVGSAYDDKMRADRRDNTHHRTTDHRIQLNKMKLLLDRHDLKVNQ